jgi:dihydroorotate dehydrogenase (fumarate)
MTRRMSIVDGNEAVASVAYRLSEVIAIYPITGHVRADLGITGGVHRSRDVIKCILAGAKVAFMTSALLRNGVHHAAYVLAEVKRWLDEHEYSSIQQMCGSMSHGAVQDPTAFERGNYMKVLSSYTMRANVFND